MGQEDNDIRQVRGCITTLSNVYKSQVQDEVIDNGNLTRINSAIALLKDLLIWMESHNNQEE